MCAGCAVLPAFDTAASCAGHPVCAEDAEGADDADLDSVCVLNMNKYLFF